MKYLILAECPCELPNPLSVKIINRGFEGDAQAHIRNMLTLTEPLLTCKVCGKKREPREFQYTAVPVPTMCMLCRASLTIYHAYFFRKSARQAVAYFIKEFPELRTFLRSGQRLIWTCEKCWPNFKSVRNSWRAKDAQKESVGADSVP